MKTLNRLAATISAFTALCLLSACETEIQQNSAPHVYDPAKIPTGVVTGNVIDNLGSSAVITGSVAGDGGGGRLLDNGIVVDTSDRFKPGLSFGAVDSAATGEFSVTVGGLLKGRQYYYRAYALNANGAAYGETKSFVTANVTFTPYATKFDPTKPADIADWVFDKYTGFDESEADPVWFTSSPGLPVVACYHDGDDLTIVSPLIRITSAVDTLSFQFYAGYYTHEDNAKVKVYVTEDLKNLGAPLKDWTLPTGGGRTKIPMEPYFGKSIYVVIVVEAGSVLIYNFAIAPPAS